nr:L,D-transpeptidase family protein [Vibrio maerlii]
MLLKTLLVVLLNVVAFSCFTKEIDLVKVDKSKRRLYLMANQEVIKEYRIALGANPQGHKKVEGDKKTPEGFYRIIAKNEESRFYRSLRIDYPNEYDASRAFSQGQNPGGDIMIHGLKNGETRAGRYVQSFDWTDGCIALLNHEMDELFDMIEVGTPIQIEW